LKIDRDDFHGDWNYTIRPRTGDRSTLFMTAPLGGSSRATGPLRHLAPEPARLVRRRPPGKHGRVRLDSFA
jgi:hypothetical protein